MKYNWRFIAGASLVILGLSFGAFSGSQTHAQLDLRYRVIRSYEIRPGIVMTPKYTIDGQVCEMELEPRHQTATGITFGQALSEHLVRELVQELVPISERGKELESEFNTTVQGSFTSTKYPYEKITVEVYGTIRPSPNGDFVAIIKWYERSCAREEPSKR
jgi:hypothetical protein